MTIHFNVPTVCGNEFEYIKKAIQNNQLSGDGLFTQKASLMLENIFQAKKVLLTHSCTAALEICALLLDIKPGDEVIMPSFTFVSTANAFALRGAIPVFVDIDPITQNIDISLISQAITNKTKAIVVVHYAGVSVQNLDELQKFCKLNEVPLIEDAAQAIFSSFKDKPLGSFGDLATCSFHETKNISCGEGGCLIINDSKYIERAEIIREKGTNRSKFFRGETDKYTWVDIGSSYLPGELSAAFLCAQLDMGKFITQKRLDAWNLYNSFFNNIEFDGISSKMFVPAGCKHNAHMYYIIAQSLALRSEIIYQMSMLSVKCVFHYVPLHSSPFGIANCRYVGDMRNTTRAGDCLLRLPLYPSVNTNVVIQALNSVFNQFN